MSSSSDWMIQSMGEIASRDGLVFPVFKFGATLKPNLTRLISASKPSPRSVAGLANRTILFCVC